ncbi:FAD synthase-like [Zophobas morio]
MSSGQLKTAGILVLGDELLRGEVVDCNSPHITKDLYKFGVNVRKISIIADDVDEICNEIKTFSKAYNYVITSGGIGPTHDDVTFEAVGKAFGVPVALNGQLRGLCERFYKTTDVNHPGMKLAMVPETAKLTFTSEFAYPVVSVENVYMFPGIPELFLKSFKSVGAQLFKGGNVTFYSKVIYVTLTEDKIADELGRLAGTFPDVHVGSYPQLFHALYKVKITLESTSEKSVNEAYEKLLSKFPKESVIDVDNA